MQWQSFKELKFLCQTQDSADSCVVLFHGYGADASDLAPLAGAMNVSTNVDWFFPQGVLEVELGPMMSGRAWFPLRQRDFENLSARKVEDRPLTPETEELLTSVAEWLNHLGKLYKNVFIGGFSQGAILTSHSFYRLQFSPAALLLLSGYLSSPSAFPTLPEQLKVPFFQSHGSSDMVLPISGARQLFDKLTELGLKGEWSEFGGAHEIPMSTIRQLGSFLNGLLEA